MIGGRHFSCGECAAQPKLTTLQGCWEPTPRPFARFGEYEFDRCPLTYLSSRAAVVVRDVVEGALEGANFVTKMQMPAKRLQALRFVETLVKKEQHDD